MQPKAMCKLPPLCRGLKPRKGVKALLPVGAQRIAKVLKESMCFRGKLPSSFLGKDIRSLAASLAFNLGVPMQRIIPRGRWSRAHTVVHHYVREVRLREYNPKRVGQLSMAEVLRTRTSAVN